MFPSFPRTRRPANVAKSTWWGIAEEARNIKSRGRVKRFFTSNVDAKKLKGLVEKISVSIQERFMVSEF